MLLLFSLLGAIYGTTLLLLLQPRRVVFTFTVVRDIRGHPGMSLLVLEHGGRMNESGNRRTDKLGGVRGGGREFINDIFGLAVI